MLIVSALNISLLVVDKNSVGIDLLGLTTFLIVGKKEMFILILFK